MPYNPPNHSSTSSPRPAPVEGPSIRVAGRSAGDVRLYARRRYGLFIAHLAVGVAFLAVMIGYGSAPLAAAVTELAGPGAFFTTVLLYFAGFSLAYLIVTLPLTFYGEYALEHRFGLSTQTLGRWAGRRVKKWLLSFVIAAPLVLAFYALLRRWPVRWWVPASAVWVFFSYVLSRFAPRILIPLFYKLEPIGDAELAARLGAVAEQAGIPLAAVCRIDLSRETKKANAAVVGVGSARRVVLGDTLLASFTHDEIASVFAHEVGHIVRHHVVKGLALGAALIVASLFAASRVLLWAAATFAAIPHVHSVQTFPILVAVLAAIEFLVLPFEKWYSRRCEIESDEYAIRSTGDRESFISAMRKLAALNLADVRPNKLAELFLFSHPPISKRIRFAAELKLRSET